MNTPHFPPPSPVQLATNPKPRLEDQKHRGHQRLSSTQPICKPTTPKTTRPIPHFTLVNNQKVSNNSPSPDLPYQHKSHSPTKPPNFQPHTSTTASHSNFH
ncbi:hypothetical protein BDZ45DRAFT_472513 [Acephala macrosclerotiorum]|nr:hypothetical protein BDZ45DRAFT_472513 [Acephala macrosclerotiorum]